MPAEQTSTLYPINDKSATFLRKVVRWAGPASYATGGETLDPQDTGLGRVRAVVGVISNGSAVRIPYLSVSTQKLQWYVPNTGAEVANAVDLSTFVGQVELIGI